MPGFLTRLFGRRRPPPPPVRVAPPPAIRVAPLSPQVYLGHETLEVVGESHYQDELWRVVGGRTTQPIRYETLAELLPDPGNPHDANAIEVQVNRECVGYLSREDAVVYGPGLRRLIANHGRVAFHALVVGGGPRGDRLGYLGVFLQHDPSDFGLPSHQVSVGSLRTGLSEARATDIEDTEYDLGWYGRLPLDDAAAITELRSLLEAERQPIARHYMLCELEHHLYRARTTVDGALDQFDAICRSHQAEMVTIRPALLIKFGSVPVIEMYRQAAIRCQKAKNWREARDWAERGLAVYGQDATRPESVEDLHKRIAYATAKIAAQEQPPPRRAPAPATTARPTGIETETLSCEVCGTSFERTRTRGRKPKRCPTCRSTPGYP
jgi:rubrerythrin